FLAELWRGFEQGRAFLAEKPLGDSWNSALKPEVREVAASRDRFPGGTQMVKRSRQDSEKKPAKQGPQEVIPEPNKIGSSTPYDFEGKNLTPYGGLLPVATMLEKLGFRQVVEETVTVKRALRWMAAYKFVLAMEL